MKKNKNKSAFIFNSAAKQLIKKLTLAAILILSTHLSFSQAYKWAKSIGSAGDDIGYSITTDAFSNVYITGSFAGTADFDPGVGTQTLTSVGGSDIFFAKYNSNGNYLWAKSIGSSGDDIGYGITTDAFGNFAITGNFRGTADFDPGSGSQILTNTNSTTNTNFNIFFAKYDSNGSYIWAKSIGFIGYGGGESNSIDADASGNIYITGSFNTVGTGTADFDPGVGTQTLTSVGGSDIFFAKYNSNGNYLWAKSIGSIKEDAGRSITTDTSGNVYITGSYGNTDVPFTSAITADFDPGLGTQNLTSIGYADIFFAKYDSNGNYIWAKSIGSTSNNEVGNSITLDVTGNVYITGSFRNVADFDPGGGTQNLTTNSGYNEIFFGKYDSNGNYIWAKKLDGGGNSYGNNITTDAAGNIYITGGFGSVGFATQGYVDFDPGVGMQILTSNAQDIFFAKYDNNGGYLWAKSIGSSSVDLGNSIANDAAGNVYITGSFRNAADFDPGVGTQNLTSLGSKDIFFAKYFDCSPAVTTLISSSNVSCYGFNNGGAIAIAAGGSAPYSYLWSSDVAWISDTTFSISNLTAGSYTITVTDINDCENTATFTITEPDSFIPQPNICMVTVDSVSQNNVIYWDNTGYTATDTFYVYRDIANNNYALIGKQPYSSMQFSDTVRVLYLANGDPNASSWRYKIAAKDSCGNMSAMSPYHQTIFFQNNSGNFNWTPYQIEGATLPIPALSNYLFKRDNLSTNNWNTIQTLSASSTLYTDLNYALYQTTGNWRIETQWSIFCSGLAQKINAVSKSRSNVKNNNTVVTNLVSLTINDFKIMPNPASAELTISSAIKFTDVKIVNSIGQIVQESKYNNTVSVAELSSGIYFVQLFNENGKLLKVAKFIKE